MATSPDAAVESRDLDPGDDWLSGFREDGWEDDRERVTAEAVEKFHRNVKRRIASFLFLPEAAGRHVAAHNLAVMTRVSLETARAFLAELPVDPNDGRVDDFLAAIGFATAPPRHN
jgi:hypothetical protein